MITLTKEWLLTTIAELEEERDAVPGAVNEDAAMALAAMKLALASIEAEPVSAQDERYQHLSEIYHAQEKRLFKLAQRIKGESFDKYSQSPSQAIDVLESAIFGESAEEDSRSAMLQGVEHVSNRDELPDGWVACSERMPEDGDKVLTSFRGGMRTAVCKVVDVLGHKIFVDELTLFNGVPADHWQPLPAAPQQEVK